MNGENLTKGSSHTSINVALNRLAEEMKKLGLTSAEVSLALAKVMKALPPIEVEKEIFLINMNPSLNAFQKWWLIRKIRKEAENV